LYEAKKPEGFRRVMLEAIRDEKFNPARFSIRELAEATNYPWQNVHGAIAGRLEGHPRFEAVDFTSFPTITTEVITRKMLPEYDLIPSVSSSLCVEIPSETEHVRVPGFTDPGAMLQRGPGGYYDETDMTEIWMEFDIPQPYGRLISLKKEDIQFDRTGTILTKAATIGRGAKWLEEREFFCTFADAGTAIGLIDGTAYAYYPKGTRTAMYTTGTSDDTNGITPRYTSYGSNALSDATDVQNADSYLAKQTDVNGRNLMIPATHLIVPRTLGPTARKIRATMGADKRKTGGVTPTSYTGGHGDDQDDFTIISSPILDGLSTSTWYWGNPRMQFARFVLTPLTVDSVTLPLDNPDRLKRDIVFVARAAWRKKTVSLDYRCVIKNTA